MNCYILDDIFWKSIYEWLVKFLPQLTYPVKENIKSPLWYIDQIKNDDIILLDNFFPWSSWWEEPLWEEFLEKIMNIWNHPKIIWISDYWKVLINKFDNWATAYKKWIIIDFVPTKDPKEIAECLEKIFKI